MDTLEYSLTTSVLKRLKGIENSEHNDVQLQRDRSGCRRKYIHQYSSKPNASPTRLGHVPDQKRWLYSVNLSAKCCCISVNSNTGRDKIINVSIAGHIIVSKTKQLEVRSLQPVTFKQTEIKSFADQPLQQTVACISCIP
jgi:hypothetical protein